MSLLIVLAVLPPDPQLVPLLWGLAAVLVVAGIAGTVVPTLPGAPLVFLGLLVAAWADGFARVGWVTLSILAVLAVASYGLELWAAHRGTRRAGASRLALIGAFLGGFAGLFFSLPGVVLGPFLGAFAGEYLARRDLRRAGKVGLATWWGLLLAAAAHLALIFSMLGIFAVVYLIH